MELIDVYDINRKKLNYTKVRGTLDNNEYNIASELWLINNHKLLITKRAINKSHPNEWEVPGGCSIINENTLDTLIREIKEEINISLNKDDCIFIDTYIYKNQFLDIYKSTYLINKDLIKLQLEEVSEYKFVTEEEFINMNNDHLIVESVFNRYKIIKDKIAQDW